MTLENKSCFPSTQ